MTMYVARVELYDASYENYKALYKRMAALGYLDAIPSDNGQFYRLPPGEYFAEKPKEGGEEILEQVKSIAAGIVQKYAVVVTAASWVKWNGLEAIEQVAA